MKLWSNTFRDGGLIPAENAFAAIDPYTHMHFSANRNPHLAWSDIPYGTRSLALFCYDCDAPRDGQDVNVEGKVLLESAPRGEFFHWVLVDVPTILQMIKEGQFSAQVTPHGKSDAILPHVITNGSEHNLRQGINDYTHWFGDDPAMAGDYYGYDGPCPPWNDARIHHYIFRLYALDIEALELAPCFTGQQVGRAMQGHILDEAQLVGAYSLNPELVLMLKK
ncbi:MAG: Raf kinase inhibitor-like YbhB/YbcL family protein [Janthinobacterium sp.]|jgi:Raf kinase inhibitor-like YbhB/YbcL family protein